MSDQNSDLVQNILPLELKKKRGSMTSWRGNKYPEVKLRGFYSDIASYQNAERTNVNYQLFMSCLYFKTC